MIETVMAVLVAVVVIGAVGSVVLLVFTAYRPPDGRGQPRPKPRPKENFDA